MTNLTTKEKRALVDALENDGKLSGTFCSVVTAMDLYACGGLVRTSRVTAPLTDTGKLLAQALRESSRLERARERLKEWEKETDDEWSRAVLELDSEGRWLCELSVRGVDDSRVDSDDPLTAVIEASKRTPWELEE